MKSFYLPNKIIEIFNFLDDADRGQAYSAFFHYSTSDTELTQEELDELHSHMSKAAIVAFEFARLIAKKSIDRRRAAAKRKKELDGAACDETGKESKNKDPKKGRFVMEEIETLSDTLVGGISGKLTPRVRIGDEIVMNLPQGDYQSISDPRMQVRAAYAREKDADHRNKVIDWLLQYRFGREVLDHNASGYFLLGNPLAS